VRLINLRPGRGGALALAVLPFLLLLATYLVSSQHRLQANPDDKLLPSFATIAASVNEYAFKEDARSGQILWWADTWSSLRRLLIALGVASAIGLTFGIAGYAMMLFAGLLGARKKVPVWRVGRTQTWMRGHLWLGLLSFPMILYHGGFAWKGQLTAVLMILLFIVILSGIIGAAIQHYVPSQLTASVPLETIYEEIPHVRQQLRDEADQLVSSICGPLTGRAVTPLAEENEPASRS